MKYRNLGNTNLKVSVIGFGGGALIPVDRDGIRALVKRALAKGINIIDVDKNVDEKGVGLAIKGTKMIVASKSMAISKLDMEKDLKDSLLKLGRKCIDLYQLHLVNDLNEYANRMKGAYKALEDAKKQGLIKYIGLSSHNLAVIKKAILSSKFDTVMFSYNLGHRDSEDLITLAKEHGVGIFVKKVLGGGFLVDPDYGKEEPKKGAEKMTAENAIKFVLSNKNLSCALIGMNQLKEVDEAAAIGNKEYNLSKKEIDELNDFVEKFLGKDYCRTCKYCVPCPVNPGFEIDQILRLHGFFSRYGYKSATATMYNQLEMKADLCTACGECMKKCPYNIDIPHKLYEAHAMFKEQLKKMGQELKVKVDMDEKEDEWNQKAGQFRAKNDFKGAIKYFVAELKKFKVQPIILLQLGSLYLDDNQLDKAIKCLEKSLDLAPTIDWASFLLGKAYYFKKDYKKAMAALNYNSKFSTQPLSNFYAWYLKAIIHDKNKEIAERDKCILKIISYKDHFMKDEEYQAKPFLDKVIKPYLKKNKIEIKSKHTKDKNQSRGKKK